MRAHSFHTATSVEDATKAGSREDAAFIAGGTNQIDHMKAGISRPAHVVDISDLELRAIEDRGDAIRYGTLVTNTAAAEHELTKRHAPLISMTIVKGATQQIRNMATLGGNLLQGVRCPYFYDLGSACNRRQETARGPKGCTAIGGFDRLNAIFGISEHCTAANPSDMALSFAAYDVRLNLVGPGGGRTIPFAELHREPGNRPWVTNTLRPGEVIVSIDVPKSQGAGNSYYTKVRDRQSYAFATLSAAASLALDGGTIRDARIACGGVGSVPWRLPVLEDELNGQPVSTDLFARVAAKAAEGAQPGTVNAFKLDLLPKIVESSLVRAAEGTPSDPTFFA